MILFLSSPSFPVNCLSGMCPMLSVEERGQELVKQCLSVAVPFWLSPRGCCATSLDRLLPGYQAVLLLPASPASCYRLSLASPILGSRWLCAPLRLQLVSSSCATSCSPTCPHPLGHRKALVIPSRHICPATVLGGRTFLLPFFQFGLRW